MRAAARKPANAQIMTFWKKVECTTIFTAVKVPDHPLFESKLLVRHGSCGFLANDQPCSSSTRRPRGACSLARTRAETKARCLATCKTTQEIVPFTRDPLHIPDFRGLPARILFCLQPRQRRTAEPAGGGEFQSLACTR